MGNTTSPLYAQQLQIGHWLQVVGRPVRDRVPQGDDTDVDCSHALREIAARFTRQIWCPAARCSETAGTSSDHPLPA
jgi:hypothetical protein